MTEWIDTDQFWANKVTKKFFYKANQSPSLYPLIGKRVNRSMSADDQLV